MNYAGKTMRRSDDNAEDARIADNLRRTIELTELGLAFTKVRLGVQRQIALLCQTRTPLGVDI